MLKQTFDMVISETEDPVQRHSLNKVNETNKSSSNRKPHDHWISKEKVNESAKPFLTLSEWTKAHAGAVSSARKHGWFIEVTAHMERGKKPNGHWEIKENVIESARSFKTRNEWSTAYSKAVVSAKKNGWFEEATAHMVLLKRPAGYWQVKENVIASAKQFKTRSEWSDAYSTAKASAKKNGWLNEATAHMEQLKKLNGHWNSKENVIESAKPFKTLTAWTKVHSSAVGSARKNGWIEEATAHMEHGKKPNGHWEIKENVIESAESFKTKAEWTKAHVSAAKSARKNGWIAEATAHMIKKQVSLGRWQKKENVIESAKSFKTRAEWTKAYGGAARAARKNGWFEEATAHMIKKQVSPGRWQKKEKVINSAKPFKTRAEWTKAYGGATHSARKNGWFEEATAHMELGKKPDGHWKIKENVIESAKSFKTRTEWIEAHGGAASSARKNGWFEEAIAHMEQVIKPMGYWKHKENVIQSAKRFKNTSEWSQNEGAACHSAKRHGWLDEATAHMIKTKVSPGHWQNKEEVINSAKPFNNLKKWRETCSAAHKSAKDNGWFEEATAHMEQVKKLNGYWKVKDNVINSARSFTKKSDWSKAHSAAALSARKNGWLDEATAHMINVGNSYKRAIYCFMSNGHVYTGLTCNISNRWNSHRRNTKQYKQLAEQFGEDSIRFYQLTDYISVKHSQDKEDHFINVFRKRGFVILNIAKSGAIGGTTVKWTKEAVLNCAKQFKTINEWENQYGGAINIARNNGWMDEATAHMISLQKPGGYWQVKENVIAFAKQFKTLTEWTNAHSAAVASARKIAGL